MFKKKNPNQKQDIDEAFALHLHYSWAPIMKNHGVQNQFSETI